MSTMLKYAKLVENLFTQTQLQKMEWVEDEFTSEVGTPVGNYTVLLRYGNNAQGSDLIIGRIVDQSGNHIDSFDDEDFAGMEPSISDYSSFWPLMKDLYSMAKRSAKGVDKALDEILKSFDEDGGSTI